MNKTNNEKGGAHDSPEKKPAKEVPVTKLPKMEMYAVLGLELGQKIFEKLEQVEESIEILAVQKARELNPDTPREESTA